MWIDKFDGSILLGMDMPFDRYKSANGFYSKTYKKFKKIVSDVDKINPQLINLKIQFIH